MIDWLKSAEWNKMSVDSLKLWFDKYPSSDRVIIRVCDNCHEEKQISFSQYRKLCHKCAHNTPKYLKLRSEISKEYCNDAEVRRSMSERLTQWYIDHPEARGLAKLKSDDQWSSQKSRDDQAERIRNSVAMKMEHERQIGGMDIVNHHYIYDESDLSLNTVQMTRSDHTRLHHLLKRLGVKIPHININQMEVL